MDPSVEDHPYKTWLKFTADDDVDKIMMSLTHQQKWLQLPPGLGIEHRFRGVVGHTLWLLCDAIYVKGTNVQKHLCNPEGSVVRVKSFVFVVACCFV